MAGVYSAPRIISWPPCHIVNSTSDPIWDRVKDLNGFRHGSFVPESIEGLKEDQAFSLSYNFALFLLLPVAVSLSQSSLCHRSSLLAGEKGEGAEEEPVHTSARNTL
jgi:hypothetical protein